MLRRRLVPLAAVLLFAMAACGGDEGIGKAEYIEKADATCRKLTPPKTGPVRNRAEAEAQVRKDLAYRRQANRNFEGVPEPPDGLERDVAAYKRKNVELQRLLEQQLDAAKRNQRQRYGQLFDRLGRVNSERERIADRIGFKTCGQPAPA